MDKFVQDMIRSHAAANAKVKKVDSRFVKTAKMCFTIFYTSLGVGLLVLLLGAAYVSCVALTSAAWHMG